ncbi:ABC transporter permease [Ulvibacterium sp.]|uniref:ABC transporter permease n=1 Tax=Ulvibacterium sp. TaxID=2665914 RepID=UPI002602749A|nr:ABC transporter permease [Ulvibacterium sp.]
MFKNYLKISLRHIWKHKGLSLIKIVGLAMGISAFLLLALYLKHELSYDNFYPDKDRIYRVTTKYLEEGFYGVDYPAPFSKVLVNNFPEVEATGRFMPISWFNQIRPSNQQENYFEEGFAYVDLDLLSILDIPIVRGTYENTMGEPNTILISESKAHKYFSNTNPVGQKLVINNNEEILYNIAGVFKDFPTNSHLDADFLVSLGGVEFWPGEQEYWGANMYDVYLKLDPRANVNGFNDKLSNITTKYFLPSWIERDFSNPQDIANNIKHELQPIEEIYLGSEAIRDNLPHGNKQMLWLFAFSGLLIILIACINFINLSTARYTIRSKEIGLRRVIGASKKQVVSQFLVESILFSILSLLIGVLLAYALLPFVNGIMAKSLEFPNWTIGGISILFASAIFLGIITGLYPSLYLSKLKMGSSGKSNSTGVKVNISFRNSLVVFQFVVSIVLIICTIVVYRQMKFVSDKNLGFDKEQVLAIKGTDGLGPRISTFKERILRLNEVNNASISDYLPVEGARRYSDSFWKQGRQSMEQGINSQIWSVDHDYVPTLGITMVEGRNFNEKLVSDSTAILVSKTFSEKLGVDNVIGTRITNKEKSWKVIGVFEDFHFESLKHQISSSALILGQSNSMISVKMEASNLESALSSIKEVWDVMNPTFQFRYDFLDERFVAMHKEIEGTGKLFNAFAILAIAIACLGLFSLTTFIAERRRKEIGIRKVLGASVTSVTALISKEFLGLVLIAITIAVPIGGYIMNRWLEDFAYRINLKWSIFFMAGCIAILIALMTIMYQSVKTALSNPVTSLRTE